MRKTNLVVLLLFICSSLRAQSQLIVPVAGSLAGAFDTYFRTDLTIRNGLSVPQDVVLIFLAPGRDNYLGDPNPPTVSKTLGPNETITLEDIVASAFQTLGMGGIEILAMRDGRLDENARLAAAYRIYTPMSEGPGTMSQAASAIDFSHAYDIRPVPSVALATGLRQDANFRTNVGVFNGDGYHTRNFRVTARGERGSTSVTLSVEPYSMAQVPLPDGDLGRLSIQFERLDDSSQDSDYPLPFVGYGSTVDNRSGDSWMQTALPFSTADHHPAAVLMLPAADVDGANGTHFQTDLDVTNHRDVEQTVWIGFYTSPFLYGDPRYETQLTIPPLSTQWISDVTGGLLQSPGELGTIIINTPDYGTEQFDPFAQLSATYRIWTPSPETGGGTMSHSSEAVDVQALPPGDQERVIIGVRLDNDFRCNVGIANDEYYPQEFRITASSPSGSVTMTMIADGYQLTQAPLPTADLGYVTVTITPINPRTNRWSAYATSVDNVTGDSWLQNAFTSR